MVLSVFAIVYFTCICLLCLHICYCVLHVCVFAFIWQLSSGSVLSNRRLQSRHLRLAAAMVPPPHPSPLCWETLGWAQLLLLLHLLLLQLHLLLLLLLLLLTHLMSLPTTSPSYTLNPLYHPRLPCHSNFSANNYQSKNTKASVCLFVQSA